MASTNTIVLFSIVLFYAIVGVFMGFYGDTINNTDYGISSEIQEGWFMGLVKGIAPNSWFANIISGINGVPPWVNLVLFVPLLGLFIYIMVAMIRGAGA